MGGGRDGRAPGGAPARGRADAAAQPGDGTAGTVRVYLVLAAICAIVGLSQLVSVVAGESVAGIAAGVLATMAGVFLVIDRLDAAGRSALAAGVAYISILALALLVSVLFESGFGATLLAPMAFVVVMPYVRGRTLAVAAVVASIASGLTAASGLFVAASRSADPSADLADGAVALVGVSLLAGFLITTVWTLNEGRIAAAARYAGLVHDLPVGVLRRDPAGRYVEANDTAVRMLGFPDRATLLATPRDQVVLPGPEVSRLDAAVERGAPLTSEMWMRRYDGTRARVWFTSHARLAADGSVRWVDTVIEDVSDGYAERAERERLAAIVDAAGLAITSQAVDGTILGWNRPAAALYRWPAATIGTSVYDVSPREEWDSIRANNERVAAGETVGPFEIERTYGGRTLRLSMVLLPVRDPDGTVTGIATLATDVTAQALLRAERAALEAELRDNQRLEATGRLAAGVADDVNAVIASIRSQAAVLVAELPDGTPARAATDHILHSSAQAVELTHQLLAFARRQQLHAEPLDVDALLRAHAGIVQGILGSAVALRLVPAREPAVVSVDRGQMIEVLANLALRARESMPAGGTLTITTTLRRVGDAQPDKVDVDRPNEVVLTVADTGTPIPPQILAHLFEPFWAPADGGRGAGLGLAAVHGFVRQSGGRVEASSGSDGTVITLRFPLARPERQQPLASGPVIGPVTATVLLVDDDRMVRTISRRMLVKAGYDVIEAEDAAQARVIAGADDHPFDLLVTDVVMPGMYGTDLARLLREQRPALPVVFVSGFTGEDMPADFVDEDSRFVAKPFTTDALVSAVEELRHRPAR